MQINPSMTWSSWRRGWKNRADPELEPHSPICAHRAGTAVKDWLRGSWLGARPSNGARRRPARVAGWGFGGVPHLPRKPRLG